MANQNQEIDYQAQLKELKARLEEVNQLQSLANMLQNTIDAVPNSFTVIRENLDTIASTLSKDDGETVAQKVQLLGEQYKDLGVIICKKYNVIAANIYAQVKFEKQVINDSIQRLNAFRNRQEALKSVQRKIIDKL